MPRSRGSTRSPNRSTTTSPTRVQSSSRTGITNLEEETGEVATRTVRSSLQDALKKLGGEPEPYLAVLVADGDKMGEAISTLDSADEHREFSQALAGFAGAAAKDCQGERRRPGLRRRRRRAGVRARGQVPALCSESLHDKFGEQLKTRMTLSVGVAIGHFMENLEDLLEYGRAAEKAAKKPDRNGLAVHLHKRGGSPIKVRGRSGRRTPDQRLGGLRRTHLAGDDIPANCAYESANAGEGSMRRVRRATPRQRIRSRSHSAIIAKT